MKRITLVAACAGLLLLSACASKPAAPVAVAPTDRFGPAYFDFNSAALNDQAKSDLTEVANTITKKGGSYQVEGNTDDRGTAEYNLALGQRRADAAKSFLVEKGVKSEDLKAISYGKTRPKCLGNTEECWQENRRVVVAETK